MYGCDVRLVVLGTVPSGQFKPIKTQRADPLIPFIGGLKNV